MPLTTPLFRQKVRLKLVDHLDSVLIGQMITERFYGPFLTREELMQRLDRRAKTYRSARR